MSLLTYRYNGSVYYLDDNLISESNVLKSLNTNQLKKLQKLGSIRIRGPKKIKQSLSDEQLFDKEKDNYKIDFVKYKDGIRIEVSRKNKKYGYYNFVSYIESEEDYKNTVIKDIKEQMELNKKKNI